MKENKNSWIKILCVDKFKSCKIWCDLMCWHDMTIWWKRQIIVRRWFIICWYFIVERKFVNCWQFVVDLIIFDFVTIHEQIDYHYRVDQCCHFRFNQHCHFQFCCHFQFDFEQTKKWRWIFWFNENRWHK